MSEDQSSDEREQGSDAAAASGDGATDVENGRAGDDRADDADVDTDTETAGDVRDDYSNREDRLALYEWVGGLAAGLGFFLTPIFTALPACYCAMRIRREKPISALLIFGLVATTVVFWLFVVWVVLT